MERSEAEVRERGSTKYGPNGRRLAGRPFEKSISDADRAAVQEHIRAGIKMLAGNPAAFARRIADSDLTARTHAERETERKKKAKSIHDDLRKRLSRKRLLCTAVQRIIYRFATYVQAELKTCVDEGKRVELQNFLPLWTRRLNEIAPSFAQWRANDAAPPPWFIRPASIEGGAHFLAEAIKSAGFIRRSDVESVAKTIESSLQISAGNMCLRFIVDSGQTLDELMGGQIKTASHALVQIQAHDWGGVGIRSSAT